MPSTAPSEPELLSAADPKPPVADPTQSRPTPPHSRTMILAWSGVALLIITVLLSLNTLFLLRNQGIVVRGDEPFYLITADAIWHDHSVNTAAAQQRDYAAQYLEPWSIMGIHPGDQPDPAFVHEYRGPHGLVSVHGLGLSILLAPFFGLGRVPLAQLALIVQLALLSTLLVVRSAGTFRLTAPATGLLALLLLSPVYLLASTQIFPDLMGGLLLALAIGVLARMERMGRPTKIDVVILAGSLAFLPWLHIKNALMASIVLLAAGCIAITRRYARPAIALVFVVTAASWALAGEYQLYALGRLAGPYGENASTFGRDTWATVAGLVVDRHQGILVAFPGILVGVVGMAMAVRSCRLSVTSAIIVTVATLIANGSHWNRFGGGSFAGRFWWEALPVLLLFAPAYLCRLSRRGNRRLFILGGLLAVSYGLQALPILAGDHVFDSAILWWDPSRYPGWWGPLDRFLPTSLGFSQAWTKAATWAGLAFVVAASALIVLGLVALTSRLHRLRAVWLGSAAFALTVTLIGVAVFAPRDTMPARPLQLTAAAVTGQVGSVVGGARVAVGRSQNGTVISGPNEAIGKGDYIVGVQYRLIDPDARAAHVRVVVTSTPSNALIYETSRIRAAVVSKEMASADLPPATGGRTALIPFTTDMLGSFDCVVTFSGTGQLEVDGITVTKLRTR